MTVIGRDSLSHGSLTVAATQEAAAGRAFGGKWDFDLVIAARFGGLDGARYSREVKTDVGPLLIGQDHDGNPPVLQILLVADVLVRAQEDIEAGLFGSADEFAVPDLMPTQFSRSRDLMA